MRLRQQFTNHRIQLGPRDNHQALAMLGPVYATPPKIENAALFLRLGLPSTLIRHENGACRKRSPNGMNFI